jgi:hypothetical protein
MNTCTCFLSIALLALPACGNLLVNPSFEDPNPQVSDVRIPGLLAGFTDWMVMESPTPGGDGGTSTPDNNGMLPSASIEAWTVFGHIDWKAGDALGAGRGYWRAQHGNMSLDLNCIMGGGVQQAVTTSSGTTYIIRFMLSGNPFENPGETQLGDHIRNAEVSVGTGPPIFYGGFSFPDQYAVTTFTYNASKINIPQDYSDGNPITNMNWREEEFDFVARSDATYVVFRSLLLNGVAGAAVDNISVTEIPEPGLGLVALSLCALLRRC